MRISRTGSSTSHWCGSRECEQGVGGHRRPVLLSEQRFQVATSSEDSDNEHRLILISDFEGNCDSAPNVGDT